MSLDIYLKSGKFDILKREIESLTGIQLKTMLRWLISEDRLKKQQEKRSKRRSTILITVSNKIEAKQLLANGLCFRGTVKKIEKYLETRPKSVYMKCYRIGHKRQGSYKN